MLEENNIFNFEGFLSYNDRDCLLSLTWTKDLAPIELTNPEIEMILSIIYYSRFLNYSGSNPEHTGMIQHSVIRKIVKLGDEEDSMNTISMLLWLLPI